MGVDASQQDNFATGDQETRLQNVTLLSETYQQMSTWRPRASLHAQYVVMHQWANVLKLILLASKSDWKRVDSECDVCIYVAKSSLISHIVKKFKGLGENVKTTNLLFANPKQDFLSLGMAWMSIGD
eukprot:11604353-Karenia_brevis.AAC.1